MFTQHEFLQINCDTWQKIHLEYCANILVCFLKSWVCLKTMERLDLKPGVELSCVIVKDFR